MFKRKPPCHHGGSNGLGGDWGDKTNYTPAPKSCGKCHGNGGKKNAAGRIRPGTRCPECKQEA